MYAGKPISCFPFVLAIFEAVKNGQPSIKDNMGLVGTYTTTAKTKGASPEHPSTLGNQ
jgi:hypothetical protein